MVKVSIRKRIFNKSIAKRQKYNSILLTLLEILLDVIRFYIFFPLKFRINYFDNKLRIGKLRYNIFMLFIRFNPNYK